MEEIKVGEYVRTKQGKIRQVQTIHSGERITAVTKETLINGKIKIPDIVKHSFNIIDLIEVGDYVNGAKVIKIDCGYYVITDEKSAYALNKSYTDYQIKSIVTKEQFESIKYEVIK